MKTNFLAGMAIDSAATAVRAKARAKIRVNPVAKERAVDAAYCDFYQRVAAGEEIDAVAFCEQLAPELRSSLAKLLQCNDFLLEKPELLVDDSVGAPPPIKWPVVGTHWEGFELLEELGQGAFGHVYLARELNLGRRLVAIKYAEMGRAEAATLGRLNHPNVVPIYSIRTLHGQGLSIACMPYLGRATLEDVCRHIHGLAGPPRQTGPLIDACRDERLDGMATPALPRRSPYLDGVRWVAAKIASALAYLHQNGICHRDLKPSNILMQPGGSPRLLDFNLCADPDSPTAVLGGTLAYAAPEQLAALETGSDIGLTPKLDVFAFGVILYEWLLGAHPFGPLPGDGNPEVLINHLQRQHLAGPPSLRAFGNIDRPLAQLIRRCLGYRPEERPSAVEVECELQRQLGLRQRFLRWLPDHPLQAAAAAVVLAATLGLATYQVVNQPPRGQAAYEKGWQAYRTGDFRQAWSHFNEALIHGADNAKCLHARARTLQKLGDEDPQFFSLAIADYKLLSDQSPRGELSAGMAYCAHRQSQLDAALKLYEKALAQGFRNAALHHNLGHVYIEQRKLPEAKQHLNNALAFDAKNAATHFLLAMLSLQEAAELQSKTKERTVPAPLREALSHIEKATSLEKSLTPLQAMLAAHAYAMATPFEPARIDQALVYLTTAVDLGWSPRLLRDDPRLASLRSEPAFAALTQRQPMPMPVKMAARPIDIFTY